MVLDKNGEYTSEAIELKNDLKIIKDVLLKHYRKGLSTPDILYVLNSEARICLVRESLFNRCEEMRKWESEQDDK